MFPARCRELDIDQQQQFRATCGSSHRTHRIVRIRILASRSWNAPNRTARSAEHGRRHRRPRTGTPHAYHADARGHAARGTLTRMKHKLIGYLALISQEKRAVAPTSRIFSHSPNRARATQRLDIKPIAPRAAIDQGALAAGCDRGSKPQLHRLNVPGIYARQSLRTAERARHDSTQKPVDNALKYSDDDPRSHLRSRNGKTALPLPSRLTHRPSGPAKRALSPAFHQRRMQLSQGADAKESGWDEHCPKQLVQAQANHRGRERARTREPLRSLFPRLLSPHLRLQKRRKGLKTKSVPPTMNAIPDHSKTTLHPPARLEG